MATKNPRIAVMVKPQVHEVFRRLAKLQGESMSRVVGDILESVYEPMMRTVALLEAAQEAPQQVRDGLRNVVLDLEREMVSASGSGLAQLDWMRDHMIEKTDVSKSPKSTKKPRSRKVSAPVPVTRGSGSGNPLKNKKTLKKRSGG